VRALRTIYAPAVKRLGLGLACLILTSCGGGPSYGSAKDVADAFGCGSYVDQTAKSPGTGGGQMDAGSCTVAGRPYSILWEKAEGAMYTYVFALGPAPKEPKRWLHAAGWVVHCPDVTACRAVQEKIGSAGLPDLRRQLPRVGRTFDQDRSRTNVRATRR
jgi:hypothetical protein